MGDNRQLKVSEFSFVRYECLKDVSEFTVVRYGCLKDVLETSYVRIVSFYMKHSMFCELKLTDATVSSRPSIKANFLSICFITSIPSVCIILLATKYLARTVEIVGLAINSKEIKQIKVIVEFKKKKCAIFKTHLVVFF